MPKSKGFGAFAREDAQVLILGTLPSPESLRRGEYYAHPRNAFWPIMGRLFGVSRDQPYTEHVQRLMESGIALWDVCASAHRPGSLDSDISSATPNDFNVFLSGHPGIQLICLNGAKASELYRRGVLPGLTARLAEIRRVVLPSTSPAHAGMPFEEKLKRWGEALNSGLVPSRKGSDTF